MPVSVGNTDRDTQIAIIFTGFGHFCILSSLTTFVNDEKVFFLLPNMKKYDL